MKIDRYLSLSPIFTAYLASEKLFIPFQKTLKREGLTFIQSMILIAIYFEKDAVIPSLLARTLNTSPSNISHSLKKLKNQSWINKAYDDTDERKVYIELTKNGEKKVQKLVKIYNLIQEHFENEYSERKINKWNKSTIDIISIFNNLA